MYPDNRHEQGILKDHSKTYLYLDAIHNYKSFYKSVSSINEPYPLNLIALIVSSPMELIDHDVLFIIYLLMCLFTLIPASTTAPLTVTKWNNVHFSRNNTTLSQYKTSIYK